MGSEEMAESVAVELLLQNGFALARENGVLVAEFEKILGGAAAKQRDGHEKRTQGNGSSSLSPRHSLGFRLFVEARCQAATS